MRVVVNVQLKDGVLDPQGKAVHHALGSLGFNDVSDVKVGKQIILEINGDDKEKILSDAKAMCEELLANTVIETYSVELA